MTLDEEDEKPRTWIPSAIGVATEEDRRRDRSLPAPRGKDPGVGPVSARKSGGPGDEPDLPREEYGAATGLPRARREPPPGDTDS